MGLQWARIDANISHHDKIVWLKHQRGGWKAISVYVFSIGWAVGQGTDGRIPAHMAAALDADKQTITLLTGARLWEQNGDGWVIRNFAERQELEFVTEARRAASKLGATKGNCIRWHGPDCGCWRSK